MVTSSPPSLYVNSYQVKLAQLVSCGPALFFPPPHIFASHSLCLTCLPAQPPDPIWTAHPTSAPAFPGFAECSRPGLSLRELCSFYATLFPTLHSVTVKKKNACWFKYVCDKTLQSSSDSRCLDSMNFKVHQNTLHRGGSVWNNDAFKEAAAFPTFLPLSRGGLISPRNHLEFIPGLWVLCLRFSNRHFTVIGPEGGSLKTCWKWWNFPVVEKKANNSDTCHPCRCPYKKLLRI